MKKDGKTLFWTKYCILEDSFEEGILLWNTLQSKGCVFSGGKTDLIKKSKECGYWDNDIGDDIRQLLMQNGFLITDLQFETEHTQMDSLYSRNVLSEEHMTLTLIPTDTCNFSCIYCYQSDTVHNMSREVADSILKMIEKNDRLKTLHLSWFGGEPLCNKEIVFYFMEKVNQICREKKIVLMADMTTNASLLDFETFNKLRKMKVLNYQITIDGSKRTHDIQRPLKCGKSSYEIILRNLKEIRDKCTSKFVKIGIRTNFTQAVNHDFEELKNVLVEEFGGDNRFYFFFQWVKNWGGNKIEDIKETLLSDDEAISVYGKWMDVASQTSLRTAHITQIRAASSLCLGCLKNGYLIDVDGKICKCTTGIYDSECRDKAIIGYIDKDGNRIIDREKEKFWISRDADINKCKECALYPICLGMPCPYSKIKNGKVICNQNDEYIRILCRSLARQNYIPRYCC